MSYAPEANIMALGMTRRHLLQGTWDEAALAIVHFTSFFRFSLMPLYGKLAIIGYLLYSLLLQFWNNQSLIQFLV
jgi:hypothetical protein